MPVSIIPTWGIGDMDNTKSLNIYLLCIDLLKIYGSKGPDGVICIFPEEDFSQQFHPYLLPQDDH